jgi:hypothetical protein
MENTGYKVSTLTQKPSIVINVANADKNVDFHTITLPHYNELVNARMMPGKV